MSSAYTGHASGDAITPNARACSYRKYAFTMTVTPRSRRCHTTGKVSRARANDATDGRDESELGGGGGEKRGNEGRVDKK